MSGKHSAVTARPGRRAVAVLSVVALAVTFFAAQESGALAATGSKGSVRLLVQAKAGVSKSARADLVARNGGSLLRDLAAVRTEVVSVPSGEAGALLKRYQSDASVKRVEVDHSRKVASAASDPAYGDQWALPQIGWNDVHGSVNPAGSATIAVLDTGVDASVSDLSKLLVPGYSAFTGGDPTSDPNGHGTEVASIAAAQTDNDSGIAGVAYAGASIMPVQVIGADGTGQDSDIIGGITWAADHGADVILMAFSNPAYSDALQTAVAYAWNHGAVVVAATGNGGSTSPTYPAGDANVVGVSATDQNDALWSSSNSGADAFIGAPGVSVLADSSSGTASVTGTSASAAIVAGAAALLKANDSSAANDVIVGRLARNADPAGSQSDTGNGRLNLARAISDTSPGGVTPAGVTPPADGGPFVGPYVVAQFSAALQGQSNPACGSGATCPWQSGNLTGWQELQNAPMQLHLTGGPGTITQTLTFDHTKTQGGVTTNGIQNLFGWTTTPGITISTPTLSSPANSGTWSYNFTITAAPATTTGDVNFFARLDTGARNFSGSSMVVGASGGGGNVQFSKPAAGTATSPDLAVVKTGPTTAGTPDSITYTLSYQNKSSATGTAHNVVLSDTLPLGVTETSCSNSCTATGNLITWNLGTLAPGASGTRTVIVSIPSGVSFGTKYVNNGSIAGDEADKDSSDNTSNLTTTVSFNRNPTANDDSKSTDEDTPLTFAASTLTTNDTDPDGDTLTVTGVSSATHGTVSLSAGNITYTPAANYNGPASFTYTISDGHGGTANGTVSVTVNPVNDAPTASPQNVNVASNSTNNGITLSGSDLETSAGNLSFAHGSPSHGTLNGTGSSLTYTPDPGYSGSDSFTFTVTDTGDPAGCSGGAPACSAALTSAPATVTINVNARATTTTADPATATYGDSSVTLSATVTSGITVNSGTVTFTVTDGAATVGTATTSGTVSGGNASVTYALPAGASAKNYTITGVYNPGGGFTSSNDTDTLTVAKKLLTITASSASLTYGNAAPAITPSYSGFVSGEGTSNLTTQPTCSTTYAQGSPVSGGPYATSCSGAVADNYTFSYVPSSVTVAKASLTITASSHAVTYGDAAPTITASYIGFVNAENSTALSTQPTCSTTYTQGSPVSGSPYATSCSGAVADNYALHYVTGTVTVSRALVTVTASSAKVTFGDAAPTITPSYSGFVLSQSSSVLTTAPTCSTTYTQGSGVFGSPYPTSCSGAAADNYTFTYVNGAVTVGQHTLTITASSDSVSYGDTAPTITPSYDGFVGSDGPADLTAQPTCSTVYTQGSPVSGSPYGTSCSGASSDDYDIQYVAGSVPVSRALVTVTASSHSATYGDAAPTITPSYGGFVLGQTSSVLTTAPTCSTTYVQGSSVAGAPYASSCSGAAAANYTFTYVNGSVSVSRAPLTVTASSHTVHYGDAVPTITASYSGFIDGENASALATQPTCATTYTSNSAVGGSPYGTSCSGAVDNNYTINYVAGTVTVLKTLVTVTASSTTVTYGGAVPTITASYSGFVNGQNSSVLTTGPTCSTTYTHGASAAGSPYDASCTGADAVNYAFTYVQGHVSVDRASLTITASSTTVHYGDAVPAITPTYNGFVNGDTAAALSMQPTCSTTYTSTSDVAAGPYPTSCSGAVSMDYTISYAGGHVTVQKASVTVTASSASMTFGDSVPTITASYAGFVNSQDESVLTTAPTCSTTYADGSPVSGSPYPTSCSGAAAANYSFTYVPGHVSVSRASVTVTASSVSVAFGDSVPTIAASYNGFVNGQTSSVLTTAPTCSTTYTDGSPVSGSPYPTSCSGAAAANYSFDYVGGLVSVSRASVTVTASSASVTYGDAAPAITASYAGFVNGQDSSVLTTAPTCSTTYTQGSPSSGSPYPTTCSGADADNYTFTYVHGAVGVAAKKLTVTASSHTVTYGDAAPAITPSYSGFALSEGASDLGTQPTCSTTYTQGSPVSGSPYPTSCSGAVDTNYDIHYTDGTVTVLQPTLTITASSHTVTYGDAVPTITPSYSGFVNGENASALTTQPTCSTTYTQGSSVAGSPYPTSCSGAVDTNYDIHYVNGKVTVNTHTLTITASSTTATYGDAVPTITPSYNGFVNGDDASDLTTAPTCSTAYTSSSQVSGDPYPTSCSGAVDTNYEIHYVGGTVMVGQKTLTITASSPSVTYGDAAPTISPSYNGFAGVENASNLTTQPTCSTTYTQGSPVSGNPYPTSCSGAVDGNYDIHYVNGSVTVNRALVTVTASSASVTYGDAVPTITPSYNGFVNGQNASVLTTAPTCTTVYAPNSSVAGGPYATSCSGADAANYTFTYVNGSVTVDQKLVTVTASSASVTYGDTVPTITPSYDGFVNGQNSSVLTTNPTCTTTYTPTSPVANTYPTSCSGAAAANYSFTYVPGSVTVGRKLVVITASSASVTYGAANPTTTPSYNGFVNGQNASVLTTAPSCSTTYTQGSPVSGSPYSSSCSGAVAANYTFNYVNGSVTVGQKTLTITASSPSVTYGDAAPTISPSYNGFAGVENASNLTTQPTCSTTYTQGSPVSGNPYATSCTGAVDPNYDIQYVGGTATVAKKRLDITADNKAGVFSDPVPAYTVTPSGFVLGQNLSALGGSLSFTSTVVLNGDGTIESPAGSYSIHPTGYTSSNYDIHFIDGTLAVTQESALLSYTGDTLVGTGSTATNSTATVNLSASITEQGDGHLGDKMAGRQILFTITGITGGPRQCTGTVTMPSPYAGTGTASCSIASVNIDNYTVQYSLVANGYYVAPFEDAAVTVVNSGTGFVTGGGWVNEPSLGSKSNFGFTVKFLKNGNIQGNSLYIYRKTLLTSQVINGVSVPAGEYNWIIKSNAMTALSVTGASGKCPSTSGPPCTATFTGKSTITAVNRATGVAFSLGGNNQFQVWVTDNSEPGSKAALTPDTYALRVWDSTGTYYALGTAAAQLALNGGNIQVRP